MDMKFIYGLIVGIVLIIIALIDMSYTIRSNIFRPLRLDEYAIMCFDATVVISSILMILYILFI